MMQTQTPHTASNRAPENTMSKGEKWFNWIVYSGVNYWANLAISLFTADYFQNLSGKKHLDRIIERTANALSHVKLLSPSSATKVSGGIWKTLALTTGGILATLATKPLEDNKRRIVHYLNRKFAIDQTAPDGHEETPDEIHIEEDLPHQSWWNVIKRRIYASIIIVSSGVALDHAVGLDNIKDTVVRNTNKVLKSVPGGTKLMKENGLFQRYLGFAALDVMFAGIHALTMYMTNGGKHVKLPKEIDSSTDPAGKEENGEIIIFPEAGKSRDHLKSKKTAAAERHTERAMASKEQSFSLAP